MQSTIVGLDNFLWKQVEIWSCSSKKEAQETLTNYLIAKQVEQKIAQGRADYKAGRYRIMTEKSNTEFITKLEKLHLKDQSNHA